jgi:diamine N-acetyltransferase
VKENLSLSFDTINVEEEIPNQEPMMSEKKDVVELRELDQDSFFPITKLEVFEEQKHNVAPNTFSIAQASFHETAWFRGIYVNDEPVGFVMLNLDHEKPDYFLWRFMIDKNHQGKGYGKLALDEVVKMLKQFPQATELFSSVVMGEHSPLEFYKNYGFIETDEWEDEEKVIKLDLK